MFSPHSLFIWSVCLTCPPGPSGVYLVLVLHISVWLPVAVPLLQWTLLPVACILSFFPLLFFFLPVVSPSVKGAGVWCSSTIKIDLCNWLISIHSTLMNSSSSLVIDSCHQRGTSALIKMKPIICSGLLWPRRLTDWDKPHGWWILCALFWVSMTQTEGCFGKWLITVCRRLHLCFCCLNTTRVDWWLRRGCRWLSNLFSLIASPQMFSSAGCPAAGEKAHKHLST